MKLSEKLQLTLRNLFVIIMADINLEIGPDNWVMAEHYLLEVIGVDISTKTTYELSIKGVEEHPILEVVMARAVFQSVAREYLGGIALNSIKVPTVTSLALIGTILDNTDDGIFRDEYYDNKNKMVPPGIILRVSPSFLRLGSLQIAYEKQGINGVVDIARYALKKISELEKRNIVEYDNIDDALQYISSEDKSTCFFQQRRSSSSSSSCANDYKSMENNESFKMFIT